MADKALDTSGQVPPPIRNIGRSSQSRVAKNKIPDSILQNESLNLAISLLPANYNFEVHKTVWRLQTDGPSVVALQFPEGLLMYSCIIADIFKSFAGVEVLVLGDVTYGACCIDDFTAHKLGADLIIHYGHSCLVPVNVTRIKVLYVFVEIFFDSTHLIECVKMSFPKETRIAMMGTIQFVSKVHQAALQLSAHFEGCSIPQAKPLSAGETLGCTSPVILNADVLVFVADGRFHLEAAMIRNPNIAAFRYDPYGKVLSSEGYDVERMKSIRLDAIHQSKTAKTFGLILGTLGRQGSPAIFSRLEKLLHARGKVVVPFLMSELNPAKLAVISSIQVWVQVACPRLSIDWSGGFHKPILTPYELEVAMEETQWKLVYPMDYYSREP